MPSTINPANAVDTHQPAAQAPCPAAAAPDTGKPAVIASRQRCEADGVGLSHYILMDRKAGQ